jgi:hypothetical protein
MNVPVAGVTLSMTPRQAFQVLQKAGYQAQDIRTFDQWRTGSIDLLRSSDKLNGVESIVGLSRQYPDKLINISETATPVDGQFDLHAEINRARQHFGISDDARGCTVNDKRKTGVCVVDDGNKQKPFAYLIQVRSKNRSIQLGYALEPPRGPDDPRP